MEHQKRDVKERKLVIKSFKVAPKIPSNFFETTWNNRLLLALDAIHDEKPCEESYERLYRAVEDVVVGNFGSELYEKLRQCLEARTEAVAKELKEKCHQGGSFHKSSHKKTSLGATGNSAGGLSAFSSEEEQFLKFFVELFPFFHCIKFIGNVHIFLRKCQQCLFKCIKSVSFL